MKRMLIGMSLLTMSSFVALSPAFAGFKQTADVFINASAHTFQGAVGTARNSPDSNQLIYCFTSVSAQSVFGECFATDASGTSAACTTTNVSLVNQMATVGTDSYLFVQHDASGVCTFVQVLNGSQFPPKAP